MGDAGLSIRAVAEYEGRPLRWLWPGRIPRGKLTIVSGDPSLGKSFVMLDLTARVSAGRGLPGEEGEVRGQEPVVGRGRVGAERGKARSGQKGRVLLLAAEDDVGDTIRPRLAAAGADLEQVHVLEGLRDEEGNRGFVALDRDCERILELLRGQGEWALIVIDPVSAYFDGMDPNSNADVRLLLGRLADLAEETGAAVVLVSHHRKGGYSGPAIHRTIGSLAFAAVARVVWNVVHDPTDPERRLLVPVKMNLGRRPMGMAFRIVTREAESGGGRVEGRSAESVGVVEWEPWPVDVGVDDVGENAFAETDQRDRVEMAQRWLRRQLMNGRRPSGELKRRAREAGITKRALWEAKRVMRVSAVKQGDPARWYWLLPEETAASGIEPEDLAVLAGPFLEFSGSRGGATTNSAAGTAPPRTSSLEEFRAGVLRAVKRKRAERSEG